MNRETYIKTMHNNNYSEKESYNNLNNKESHISILLNQEDINVSITDLTIKINKLNKNILTSELTYSEVLNLISNNNGVDNNLNGEIIIGINYNTLYDYLIDKNKIESTDISTLYRIEGKKQEGVISYLSGINKSLSEDWDWDSKRCPAPIMDSLIRSVFGKESGVNFKEYQSKWNFAFNSEESLFNWFEPKVIELILSKSTDINVVEYMTPTHNTLSTDTQTIFKIENSRIIKSTPLSDFLNTYGIKNNAELEVEAFLKNAINSLKNNKEYQLKPKL